MARQPAIYLITSQRNGTLYLGVTSNLLKRVTEHQNEVADGFSKKYGIHKLVYFEFQPDMPSAICREKQIKKWRRQWKIGLIEKYNPDWDDLLPLLAGTTDDPKGLLKRFFASSLTVFPLSR